MYEEFFEEKNNNNKNVVQIQIDWGHWSMVPLVLGQDTVNYCFKFEST